MNNPIFSLMGNSNPQMNTVMQLIAAMSGGQNPVATLAAINPQLAQQLQGKSPQEIEQFVRTQYMQRGINIDSALQQIQQLLQMKRF